MSAAMVMAHDTGDTPKFAELLFGSVDEKKQMRILIEVLPDPFRYLRFEYFLAPKIATSLPYSSP